ncbi:Protein PAM71-homolog [Cardamine amara subsp. amara]|uniref:GDT1 family protein n=1 Tax=Cardamine amara subsp. amara TaxID=228776 RepID=A0ABD0ZNR5_CARAN
MRVTIGLSKSSNCTATVAVSSIRKLPFLSVSESLPCPKSSRKPSCPPLRCRRRTKLDLLCGRFRVRASGADVGSGSNGGSEEDGSQSSSLDQSNVTSSESLKPQGPFPYSLSIALVLLSCGLVFSLITFVKGGPSSVLAGVAKSGFTAAFSLIFVSEIGDKTFFIAALLAMQYEKTLVLLGSMGALSLMTILSVVIGKIFQSVPAQFQTTLPIGEYAAIALLMFFGLKSIKEAWDLPPAEAKNGVESGKELGEYTEAEELVKEKASKKLTNPLEILCKSFSLVFFAEWGDRSMLATVALGAAQSPLGVASGAIAGHLVATLLAIMGGAFLANYISEKLVGYTGGALFLVFAAATFFGVF